MKWSSRILAVVTAAATLAACSSSGKSGDSSEPGTAGNSAASPIKVGVVCTCTSATGGLGAAFAPGLAVYKAWAASVNASGGIGGHQVQLVTKDDGGNPGTSLSAAQDLISQHVVAIADMTTLGSTWASAVQAAKIPVVGVVLYEPMFGTNPDFYPEGQTPASTVAAVVSTAKAAGASKLGTLYCAEAAACAQSVSLYKQAGNKLGVPDVYNAQVAATAPNYTAQCLAAKQQHVDALVMNLPPTVTARVAGSCAQQGYHPTYVLSGGGFGMNLASAAGMKDALWMAMPSTPFFADSPVVHAANAAIDKYAPGVRQKAETYNQQEFMSWASGVLLEHAIKAADVASGDSPTAADVVRGLRALHADDLDGLTVPLTFTAGKAQAVGCWLTARVRGGVPSLVGAGKVSCANG